VAVCPEKPREAALVQGLLDQLEAARHRAGTEARHDIRMRDPAHDQERKKRREGNKPEEEEEHTSSLDDPQDVHRAISVAESGGSAVRT
jgi:hypothetical protein